MGLISRVSSRTYRKNMAYEDRRYQASREEEKKTLFVKGIPFDVVERDILDLDIFRKATSCRLIMDKFTNKPKGFCYVVFDSEEDADDVYKDRFDVQMDGRNLFIDYTGKKSDHRQPSHRTDRERRSPDRYRRGRSRSRDRYDRRDRYRSRSRDRYERRDRYRSRSRDRRDSRDRYDRRDRYSRSRSRGRY